MRHLDLLKLSEAEVYICTHIYIFKKGKVSSKCYFSLLSSKQFCFKIGIEIYDSPTLSPTNYFLG